MLNPFSWMNTEKLHINLSFSQTLQGHLVSVLCLAISGAKGNGQILEFFAIVLSLCPWGHQLQNRCILFFTYNESLVHVINKQSCRDKPFMSFFRKLVAVCLKQIIVFRAKHIPGVRNKLVHLLFRLQVSEFKRLLRAYMNSPPTTIPPRKHPPNRQL